LSGRSNADADWLNVANAAAIATNAIKDLTRMTSSRLGAAEFSWRRKRFGHRFTQNRYID
jgi:hypothetical protein